MSKEAQLMLRKALKASLIIIPILFNIFGVLSADFAGQQSAQGTDLPTVKPLLFVEPQNITGNIDDVFIVSLRIFNLTDGYIQDPNDPRVQRPLGNLYAIEYNFTWDPAILQYINHTTMIPVESFPGGILHEHPETHEILKVKDIANATLGWIRATYACFSPAPVFNNPDETNTVFTAAFRVIAEGATDLALSPVAPLTPPSAPAKLSDDEAGKVIYEYRGAKFVTEGAPEASFTVSPSDGYAATGKAVTFDGSSSQPVGGIALYMWNFGDGIQQNSTTPITEHIYTAIGSFYPKLRVQNEAGTSSAWTTGDKITVVGTREIKIDLFNFSSPVILWGDALSINVTVRNSGGAPENFTISIYHNSTSPDGWTLIEEKPGEHLEADTSEAITFEWNTSLVPFENAHYYFLANMTTVPHEENATNSRESLPVSIWLVTEPYHDIKLTDLSAVVYSAGTEFSPPAIEGENMKIRLTVSATGTFDETFNLTLQITGPPPGSTVLGSQSWTNQAIAKYTAKSYELVFNSSIAGDLKVDANIEFAENETDPNDNNASITVKVVSLPHLEIAELPSIIRVNQNVTFDAAPCYQLNGSIVKYMWRKKTATEQESQFRDDKTGQAVVYSFATAGNWTVRLRVQDGTGIVYDPNRVATDGYKLDMTVVVLEAEAEGLSIEMYALIAAVACIIIVAAYLLIKRRRSK